MSEARRSRVRGGEGRKKILVVDDNPDAAELVSGLLELQGHDVRSAHSPKEALRTAADFQPEIAFLDIGLPLMDGFELALELRALTGLARCRIIAISGYDDASDRKRSKSSGFEAHLVKPIGMDVLEQIVRGAAAPNRNQHAG